MPAVSMRTTGIPSYTSSVSMGSRVVPGTGLTRARSSPSSALSSDDLPTFGRPMMASRSAFSSAGGSSSGGGSASSTLSRKSPTPIPCWAETSEGSAKPSSRISPSERHFAHEILELGFAEPSLVSAQHGIGVGDFLDKVLEALPPPEEEPPAEEKADRLAIMGRPNVGKSSLLNALLGDERALVSPVPGTTRDPIDTE